MPAGDDREHDDPPSHPLDGVGAQRALSRRTFLGAGGALVALAGCTARPGRSNPTATGSSTVPFTGRTSAVSPGSTARSSVSARATGASATGRGGLRAKGPAHEVARGSGVRPEVALTFHGAGDPALATAILTSARAGHAEVTVMAVGIWLAAHPLVAKQILAAGHELGNHTWTHPTLRDLPRGRARTEIERCRDELVRLTGSPGRWFRQSGSQHSTPLIRDLAGAAGYPVCLSYDVDSMDWTDPGPGAIVANVRAAKAGSIVSMHLGHQDTLHALPAVLRSLHGRGLRAVTVTELLAP